MTGTAAGNITPLSFVTRSTTTDNQFILAVGTSLPIAGISGMGTRRPSGDFFNDDGYTAVSGENFHLYTPLDMEAPIQLGGTVAAGDPLTSDGSGHAVTATSNNQIGGYAMQAGVSGNIITCRPASGPYT